MPLTYCTLKSRSNLLSIFPFSPLKGVASFHFFTFSPFHLFTLSPFHLFTLSPFHPFTLSPFHLFTFSSFHPFTFSSFHPFTFSPFHLLIEHSPNSRSSSWVRFSKSGVAVSVSCGGAGVSGEGWNTSCWCPCSVVWMCFART